MIKAHTPINWENEPSFNTPINEANLNKMDSTIGILDDRIIEQDTSKLDKATAYTMVKDISFNENNGVFTITLLNGSTKTLDTKLEKIAINFSYNAETQQIEIILIDGTKQYIDISSLISPIDFVDSDTIGWEVTSDWKVKAKVLDGSITEDMIQPNYLAEIKVETEKSAQSMANAKISENNAKQSELNAKASEEQALEYSNNAQPLAQSVSGMNPTATNSTDGSVIYLNNKGYTQQDGTPSPDNPIRIGGLADKGYFDGVLRQGYYDETTGAYYSVPTSVVGLNKILCNSGDKITISYETAVKLRIAFFKADGTFLSRLGSGDEVVKEYECVAPTDASYFYPQVTYVADRDANLLVADAKHICVTINGMYAVRVRTCGKNLIDVSTQSAKTVNGVTATPNEDGSITVSGTCTGIGYIVFPNAIPNDVIIGQDYTFSLNNDESISNIAIYVQSNNNLNHIGTGDYNVTISPYTNIHATASQIYKKLVFRIYADNTYNFTFYPQLEEGTEATEFEPYTETTASIPITEPLYDGDYIEVYADGSGKIVRNMYHATYKKSNFIAEWDYYAAYIKTYPADYYGATNDKSGLMFCNIASVISNPNNSASNAIKAWLYTYGANTYPIARISQAVYNALDDDSTVEFVYKMKTSTEESLTAEQVSEFMKLQTFKGVTHITADGEVTVRYYCNNDSGDTVARLSGEISSVSDKFSSDIEELQEDIKAVSADIEEQIEIKGCWEAYGDWTEGDKAGSTALKSVSYGNYRFVAVNNAGMPYYSFDGSKWFDGIITNTSALNSVTYGNGLFVAVGASGVTFYSEDGITWTAGDKVSSGVYLMSVAYGNGIFVAVGYSAGVYYSEDGVTWIAADGIPTISNLVFDAVTYGGGRFVVVGTGNAYFSLDGKTWSSGQYGGNTVLISVTYGNGRFVAVGYDGVTYYADNGASWIPGGTAGNTTLYSVTYGDGLFVVVDVSGTTYYSEDGVTWTEGGSAGSGALYGITYGKNRFVAVGTSSATYCKEKDNIAESVKDLCQTVSDITQSVTDLSNTNTYSSEEVVCGTWLGKTLYQKTFSVSALEETPHSLDDVEQIWIDDTMSFYEFTDGSTSSISGSTATCTVDKTNIMFSDIGNTSMLSTAYITLKYIKLS